MQDDDALDETVTITLETTYQWQEDLPDDKFVWRPHTVSQVVTVWVDDDETLTNSAPTVTSAVADAGLLTAGSTLTVDMANVFSDADNDDLTCDVTTSSAATATVSWSGASLTVTGVAAGNATITITAGDNYGGSVSDAFTVTVSAGTDSPPPDDDDDQPQPPQPVVQGSEITPSAPGFDGQTLAIKHVTSTSTACLDVSGAQASNGRDVQTWECNETNAQKWTLQKRTAGTYAGAYRLVSKLGNYCLDNRGDFSTSTRMGIWKGGGCKAPLPMEGHSAGAHCAWSWIWRARCAWESMA